MRPASSFFHVLVVIMKFWLDLGASCDIYGVFFRKNKIVLEFVRVARYLRRTLCVIYMVPKCV